MDSASWFLVLFMFIPHSSSKSITLGELDKVRTRVGSEHAAGTV